jgi:hypothetical protein
MEEVIALSRVFTAANDAEDDLIRLGSASEWSRQFGKMDWEGAITESIKGI